MPPYNAKHYDSNNANSKVVVSSLAGATLAHITINKLSAHAVTIYDHNTTSPATTDIVGIIKASTTEQTLTYEIAMRKGIVLDFPASYVGDVTVSYK